MKKIGLFKASGINSAEILKSPGLKKALRIHHEITDFSVLEELYECPADLRGIEDLSGKGNGGYSANLLNCVCTAARAQMSIAPLSTKIRLSLSLFLKNERDYFYNVTFIINIADGRVLETTREFRSKKQ
jgi:hypothetical protein